MLSCILNLLSDCENPHLYFLIFFGAFLFISWDHYFLSCTPPPQQQRYNIVRGISRFCDFRKKGEDKIDQVGIFSLMSLSSITKYLDKNPLQVPPSPITKLPVLVSDSLGNCLRVHHNSRIPLQFFTYSGATSAVAIDRAIPELEKLSRGSKPLVVYVWLGVCDNYKENTQGLWSQTEAN